MSECSSIIAGILELCAGMKGLCEVEDAMLQILIMHFGDEAVHEGEASVLSKEESQLEREVEIVLQEHGFIHSHAQVQKVSAK